jgi:hypothetical protein
MDFLHAHPPGVGVNAPHDDSASDVDGHLKKQRSVVLAPIDGEPPQQH